MTDNSQPNNTSLPPNPPEPHHLPGRRRSYTKTIPDILSISKRVCDNTINNPQIAEPMAKFGYDRRKMEVMELLYNEASKAYNDQVREYGDKGESYARFKKYYDLIHSEFSILRKAARIVYKKEPQKLARVLNGPVKKLSLNISFQQIKTCYENLMNDSELLNPLTQYGITQDMLNGYYANFNETSQAYSDYKREESEALHATSIRDQKIDALYDFLCDFTGFAKIAFAANPDLLVQIT